MQNTTLLLVAVFSATFDAFGQPRYDQGNAPVIGTTFPYAPQGACSSLPILLTSLQGPIERGA